MSIGQTLAFPRGEPDGDVTGDIFQSGDPRAFYRVIFGLDYRLPDAAAALMRRIIRQRTNELGRPLKILDIGCGYGTLPVLLRYPLDMNQLAHRYRDLDWVELDSEQLIALDRNYLAGWPELIESRFVAFDVHNETTDYAKSAGLIDGAMVSDLAAGKLADEDFALLSGVDMIVSLNCADFLDAGVFGQVIDAIGNPDLWCAVFALRVSPFYTLAMEAEARKLRHEKLRSTTFVQRRFASSTEWTQVLLALETQGLATVGKEAEGLLHAEFHMLRPEASVSKQPLSDMVSLSHSAGASFSGWRQRPWGV
ncbi:MAG: hypothetical protein AAFQ44_10705 [Pseudomonadota bacterium]